MDPTRARRAQGTAAGVRVALIGAELAPVAKVGGLADVMGALPEALARRGHEVVVFLPRYRDLALAEPPRERGRITVPFGPRPEPGMVLDATLAGRQARLVLIDHLGDSRFFDRPGIYDDPRTGHGYPDNGERFVFFARACLEAMRTIGGAWDVLHANDHQTAMAPCLMRTQYRGDIAFARTGSLFTIHNLGYQGMYPPALIERAGFSADQVRPGSPFEFWGQLNLMKVGILFADGVSTVSPRYAQEIQSSDELGFGLEGVLAERGRDLVGILNGIDTAVWDPAHDPQLPAHYGPGDLEGKRRCREALAARAGWTHSRDGWPIVGIISRLVDQKGFDLIERAAGTLMKWDARWVVLGRGEARYQSLFERLALEHPDRVHYASQFDEPLAHLIEAGADLFLMPSRYEPCGLNQMYSMRYGTVPVVRATGGLADTVTEFDPRTRAGTGFRFDPYDAEAMLAALRRALDTYARPESWSALVANGMAQDFSWDRSAQRYEALYLELVRRAAEGRQRSPEAVLAGAR